MDEKKEHHLRRKAIRWLLKGLKSLAILQRLGRSRAGLSKWKTRFDKLGWEGLHSPSRRPHRIRHRYDPRTRRLVIQARQRLQRRTVGLIGPQAIQVELRRADVRRRVPSTATIKRILHEGGWIQAPRPTGEVYYPQPH